MQLESIMLSEISQSKKDKYHMMSLICDIEETNEQQQRDKNRLSNPEQTGSS